MLGGRLDGLRHTGTEQLLLPVAGGAVVVHRLRVAALDDGHHLLSGDGLLLQQVRGDLVQQLPVVPQDLLGLLVALADDLDGLPIRRGVGLLRAGHGVAAVQILALDGTQRHHIELVAHTEARHQIPRHLRGAFNVVGGAGGHGIAHDLLAGAACQQRADLRQNVLLGHEELLLLRQMQRVAQRALRMGYDGDLAHRLGVLLLGRHQRMTHLVVGDNALFLLGDDGTLLFGAGNDQLEGHQQILLIHGLAALADGAQRRLVHQIGQIRADAAGGGLGDLVQIHVLGQTDVAGMHLQGGKTARQIGTIHGDAPVEAAGAQQRLVQHLRAVGSAQHDNAFAGVKAVQLRQQLVQRLLALVVAAAELAAVAGFTDGVDLVDEDDARGYLGSLLEQVADTAGAHAHEHLHKVRAGDGEERHARLARHGLGQQGLAGTGRAHQQRALGQLGADGGVLSGVMEEVDDLLQRLLGLVLSGHVLEGDAGGLLHVDLGVGLAHAADAAEASAAVFGQHTEHQHQQAHHDDGRQDVLHHEHQHRVHLRLVVAGIGHLMLLQKGQQIGVVEIGGVQRQLGILGLGIGFGRRLAVLVLLLGVGVALHRCDIDGVVLEQHLVHLAALDEGHHLAVFDLVAGGLIGGVAVVGGEIVECHRQHQRPCHQRQDAPQVAAALAVFVVFVVVGHVYPP